jgi:hypothetical protein
MSWSQEAAAKARERGADSTATAGIGSGYERAEQKQ